MQCPVLEDLQKIPTQSWQLFLSSLNLLTLKHEKLKCVILSPTMPFKGQRQISSIATLITTGTRSQRNFSARRSHRRWGSSETPHLPSSAAWALAPQAEFIPERKAAAGVTPASSPEQSHQKTTPTLRGCSSIISKSSHPLNVRVNGFSLPVTPSAGWGL